ncbi:MAG: hypothetical protein NVSMB12_09720 [Acidimicrobiales bacterium]
MARTVLISAGCALVVGPLAFGRVAAKADPVPLGGFKISSSAPGYDVLYNDGTEFEGSVPEASTTFATGTGQAIAGVFYPGPIGGNPGALAGTLLAGKGLPGSVYQALTKANYPIKAEAHSGGPNDASYPPSATPSSAATAIAHADPARAESSAQLASSAVNGLGAFGSATAHSLTKIGTTAVTTTANSLVSNVDIGGVVHIGKVTSTATATSDGVTGTGSGKTVFEGFTVGGMGVNISGSDVTVGPAKLPLGQALSQLNPGIKSFGLAIVAGVPENTVSGAMVIHHSAAVTVAWTPPQSGQTFVVTFGGAFAAANAVPGFVDNTPPVLGPSVPPAVVTGGQSAAGSSGVPPAEAVAAPVTDSSVAVVPRRAPQAAPVTGSRPVPASKEFSGGITPALVILGLAGIGAGAFGLGKVPDDVLAEKMTTSTCPLERS